MAETTNLRTIRLVGPKQPLKTSDESAHFCWSAELALSYLGPSRKDLSIINSTPGLRVLLQDPESDKVKRQVDIDIPEDVTHGLPAVNDKVSLRVPYLLTANVQARKGAGFKSNSKLWIADNTDPYIILAAKPDPKPDVGEVTRGFSHLLVALLDPLPTPQKSREIQMPRLALAANRIRVLVNAKGGTNANPLGFLRLVKQSDGIVAAFVGIAGDLTAPSKLPRVELPAVTLNGPADGPFVALDLTPDGIEFRGTIVNPLRAFGDPDPLDRINVVLRLVCVVDPLRPNKTCWTLELVREENDKVVTGIGRRIRDALEKVRSELRPGVGNPVFLDINTVADDLAVRWPLALENNALRLPGTNPDKWTMWVDRAALRTSLAGTPVRGGELPTEVAIVANRLELRGSKGSVELELNADRREAAAQDGNPGGIPGPKVTLGARTTISAQKKDGSKTAVTWFVDQKRLARRLVDRYRNAGVQPDAAKRTYAFLPLTDGWLQLPFDLPKQDSDAAALGFSGAASDSIGFASTVDYVLDDGTFGEGPVGRRISLAAADYVRVNATLKQGKIDTVGVELMGAAGTADGLLWLAAGSPTAENILPGFGAGPAALESPALTFSRKTATTEELLGLTSGDFTPGKTVAFSIPKHDGLAPAYVWQGYSEMPFVTAVGITRTAESSGLPSSTRDLLCRELDRTKLDITLQYDGIHGIPALTLTDPVNKLPLAGKELLSNVPLVPVTLPGIEMKPAPAAYAGLQTRLRFDLPILDELFATTTLPEKPPVPSNDAPAPQPPPDLPTSLDFDGLLLAWQKAVDRLDLSRVQIASAFEFSGQSGAVAIKTMIEGITWSTNFALSPTSDIGSKFAFGTYTFGNRQFQGRTALEGLTETHFDRIDDVAGGEGDAVKVVGFAAPLRNQKFGGLELWRDTRAALMASRPTTDRFCSEPNGIVFREAGHFLRIGDSVQGTMSRYSCTTIFKPVDIVTADDKRKLGLWFRDLPLQTTEVGKASLVDDPRGPELSIGPRQEAFDAEQLPRALYEWRVCNDAVTQPALGLPKSAFDVDIGPLRLRPLRLLDLDISKQSGSWQIDSAKIVFTASLRSSVTRTNERGPFEPELAYATGNLVALSLIASDGKLNISEWQDVQVATSEPAADKAAVTAGGLASVSFRMGDVQTTLGSGGKSVGNTTARLTLNIKQAAGNKGIPQFDGASLATVLFGRSVVLTGGKVTQPDGKTLAVDFKAPSDASPSNFSGVKLDNIKLEIVDKPEADEDSTWTLFLQGMLTISANDLQLTGPPLPGKNVVAYTLGGPLRWLNQQIAEAAVAIDHQRGVMTCRIDGGQSKLQPIVGLTADQGLVRGILMVAVAPKPLPAEGQFRFRSFSGFGELNLLSEKGPLQRFDHMIVGQDRLAGQEPPWSSEITVDLMLENRLSRIRWPIKSLPDDVKTLDDKVVKLENLGARLTGAALRGELKAFDDASALTHSFTTSVKGQAIETNTLDANGASLVKPWSFHALTEHTIKDGAQRQLTWMSLDHVSAVDARALVSAAKAATKLPLAAADRMFAFAPRYKIIDDKQENDAIAVKGGLVLRAFAQAGFPVEAMARAIADKFKTEDPGDAIVISGAGPAVVRTSDKKEGPFWPAAAPRYISSDSQGVVLALPWIGAVDDSYKLDGLIEKFCQAPGTGTAKWDAADADWAAGSPTPLDRKSVPVQAIANASDQIRALLGRAMGNAGDKDANRALAAVEQLFLRLSSGGGTLGERPMWLRSLLALRTVWDNVPSDDKRPFGERVTTVLSSGKADGKAARVRLKRRDDAPDEKPLLILARRGMLYAIDRNITRFEELPPGEGQPQGVKDAALGRARQVARADRLVSEAVAILVIAETQQRESGADELWIKVDVPRDPDNSVLDIPIKIDPSDRLYASPALGWPTSDGTGAAASGALGMGGDWPFQDIVPKPDPVPPAHDHGEDDVKRYGSGLSGRAASISLPARADRKSGLTNEDVDTISPIYYALSRKMIFSRPESANLPLVSPPARYLTSSEARAVVPVSRELKAALGRVVKGKAAPMVPPHLERITFGLRPGAIQAEFDTLLFTDGIVTPPPQPGQEPQPLEDMSIDTSRYGRPGHGGPRLLRQLRPPRAPALPRVPEEFVESHGRRTFVELDDLDSAGGFPAPFRVFEGVATVLRKDKKSYWIRVLDMPLVPEWNQPVLDDWKQGNVTLEVTSPSFTADNDDLAKALAALGLLRKKPGLYAALSINRSIVTFNKARWSRVGTAIRLTLHADVITGAQARLDEVDGDSDVVLLLQCGKDGESSDPPHQDEIFDLGPAGSNDPTHAEDLVPETRHQVSLRLPVRPTSRPSVTIDTSTLVFADPSYDRELCGPGASDTQRDNNGKSWKVGLDRFEYGSDTPLYLAFGRIDAATGRFESGVTDIKEPLLLVQRQRQSGKDAAEKAVEVLSIAGINAKGVKQPDGKEWTYYVVAARQAYAISFDQLRSNGQPVKFEDGDEIVVSISFTQNEPDPGNPGLNKDVPRTLSARAKVVPHPVIAPPPAVYSLVVPEGSSVARVALHATAPLPQRIEFPALLDDLAIGFIRRRALFVWQMGDLPTRSPDTATLLKIDRAGGGQLPENPSDIRPRLPLPALDRVVCAGHVFGRTWQLTGTTATLAEARRFIAGVAYKRNGSGMPPARIPSAADLEDQQTKAVWELCLKAADDPAGDDVGQCLHFVIWYSDDAGKAPSKTPSRLPDDWPYEQAQKIEGSLGPFVSVGVPVGDNIFVMKYCGVI
ncbi:hypothetical protein ACU8M0_25770 (plasmid) [Rhizobium leguminosarum]